MSFPLILDASQLAPATEVPLGLEGYPTYEEIPIDEEIGKDAKGNPIFKTKRVPIQFYDKQLARVGDYQHVATGEQVLITPERMKEWADNFKRLKASGRYPFIPNSHTDVYDASQNNGEVLDVRRDGDSLIGRLKIVGSSAIEKVLKNDVSIGIKQGARTATPKDQWDGEWLHHVSLVPKGGTALPHLGNWARVKLAASADGPAEIDVKVFELAGEADGHWVTIDGVHVHIKNGRIDKGPAALVGHKPEDHGHDGKPDGTDQKHAEASHAIRHAYENAAKDEVTADTIKQAVSKLDGLSKASLVKIAETVDHTAPSAASIASLKQTIERNITQRKASAVRSSDEMLLGKDRPNKSQQAAAIVNEHLARMTPDAAGEPHTSPAAIESTLEKFGQGLTNAQLRESAMHLGIHMPAAASRAKIIAAVRQVLNSAAEAASRVQTMREDPLHMSAAPSRLMLALSGWRPDQPRDSSGRWAAAQAFADAANAELDRKESDAKRAGRRMAASARERYATLRQGKADRDDPEADQRGKDAQAAITRAVSDTVPGHMLGHLAGDAADAIKEHLIENGHAEPVPDDVLDDAVSSYRADAAADAVKAGMAAVPAKYHGFLAKYADRAAASIQEHGRVDARKVFKQPDEHGLELSSDTVISACLRHITEPIRTGKPQSRLMLALSYNPNQPRDADGKWTDTGVSPGRPYIPRLTPRQPIGEVVPEAPRAHSAREHEQRVLAEQARNKLGEPISPFVASLRKMRDEAASKSAVAIKAPGVDREGPRAEPDTGHGGLPDTKLTLWQHPTTGEKRVYIDHPSLKFGKHAAYIHAGEGGKLTVHEHGAQGFPSREVRNVAAPLLAKHQTMDSLAAHATPGKSATQYAEDQSQYMPRAGEKPFDVATIERVAKAMMAKDPKLNYLAALKQAGRRVMDAQLRAGHENAKRTAAHIGFSADVPKSRLMLAQTA